MNSMQAYACALDLNIDKDIVKKALADFSGVKGRLERVDLFADRGFSVFIDYAHTPDALLKALDTLKSIKNEKGRLVLLFGCGGDREKQKRRIMGEIAVNNADFVIITSDNPRAESPMQIINDILVGVGDKKNFTVIPDRRRAIEYAIANAMAKDIILLAGKGHENYEINAHGTFHFDEREVLSNVIKLQGGMNYED
jgi:UDP-N-acetylmuramoyl-L-alanyl-D-glutamate--2,6-diaminopimelate ligase